jgi:cytochrome oxidase assembly protein ShyY1
VSRRGTLLFGWALALIGIALFVFLGVWQAGRAIEKERMLDEAAQALERTRPVGLDAAADPTQAPRHAWASGRGRFAAQPALLLDNQQRDGHVGLRVYGIFEPEKGTPLLVDLGWQPLAGERRLPAIELPAGPLEVRGLLAPPPSSGVRMGLPLARQPGGAWLMTRVEMPAISAALGLRGPLAPRVLRLDPALPVGYPRDLALLANTLSPDKHRGYAVQWFGLAAAVLVIALVLTFRRSRR